MVTHAKTSTRLRNLRLRSVARAFAILAVSLFFLGDATAAGLSEAEVKAAFIYNFAKFSTWPANAFQSPTSPLTLCYARANESETMAIMSLRQKPLQGRPLQIRKMAPKGDWRSCHLAYLTGSDEGSAGDILALLEGAPTLTIGDIEDFAENGGMIGFVAANENIRFEINTGAAKRGHITFSAQLLSLARIVKDRQPLGGMR